MQNAEAILTDLSDRGELPGYYPASLDRLEPSFRSFLLLLRTSLNEALNQANTNVTDGVVCGTFHLDFVDAPVENAFAFQHQGYAFIIITIRMAELLLQLADKLSRAQPVGQLLPVDRTRQGVDDALRAALFFVELTFLVSHEFTHHVHEHLPAPFSRGLEMWREFGNVGSGGSRLEEQAQEADADAYAVYIALNHLIAEGGRAVVGSLFTENAKSDGNADEGLFALFLVAVGAVLFALDANVFDVSRVYTRQHPPEALRMNYVMHSAKSWRNQNRPLLERWISLEIFQTAMAAVAEALFGPAGRTNWSEQTRFLCHTSSSRWLNSASGKVTTLGRCGSRKKASGSTSAWLRLTAAM
jgi:hypothetical protein